MQYVFKCEKCGAQIVFEDDTTNVLYCSWCGKACERRNSKEHRNRLQRAYEKRKQHDFEAAEAIFEEVLKTDPSSHEALWGRLLCKYGVEYAIDKEKGSKDRKILCHRARNSSIQNESDYELIINNKNVPEKIRLQYAKEAEYIDGVQAKIRNLAEQKKDQWDVFICYKETDIETGLRTEESHICQSLYNRLIRSGYRVFFARETLRGKIGEDYEAEIYHAINTAKVMLVVGLKKEHFNATWPKSEWSRYLERIENGSGVLIPLFGGGKAEDILPQEFLNLHMHGCSMDQMAYAEDIESRLYCICKKEEPKSAEQDASVSLAAPTVESLIQRMFIFLEDAEERRREEARIAEERRREEARLAEERRREEARLAEERRIKEKQIADAKEKRASIYLEQGLDYEFGRGVEKDLIKAAEWYEKAAREGNVLAQRNLALCFMHGKGVPADYAKAIEWLKKAAEAGNAAAQCDLGWCYETGNGTVKNMAAAVLWYEKAAQGGEIVAKFNLAICYIYGNGVLVDYAKALPLLTDAANDGYAQAQCELGVCYEHGRGVEKDLNKAFLWYSKSAEQNNVYGLRAVGLCYEFGRGAKIDYARAREYYLKAKELGYPDIDEDIKRLAETELAQKRKQEEERKAEENCLRMYEHSGTTCMYCFADTGGVTICLKCGGDANVIVPKDHLAPGTVLNEKWLIGRAVGQDAAGIVYAAIDLNSRQKARIREYFPKDCAQRMSDGSIQIVPGEDVRYHTGLMELRTDLQNAKDPEKRYQFFEINNSLYVVQLRPKRAAASDEPHEKETEPRTNKKLILVILVIVVIVVASVIDRNAADRVNTESLPTQTPLDWEEEQSSRNNSEDDYYYAHEDVVDKATEKSILTPAPDPVNPDSSPEKIKALQRRLIELGWLDRQSADGNYDTDTRYAVAYFQKHIKEEYGASIKANGYADELTMLWLNDIDAPVNPARTPEPTGITNLTSHAPILTFPPTFTPVSTPTPAPAYENEIIAGGYRHTLVIGTDGTVKGFGKNNHDQINVDGWKSMISVAGGLNHSVGLTKYGRVFATGDNEYGQCNVSGLEGGVMVAAGWDHTVVLHDNGRVTAVGLNTDGQCNVSDWKDIVYISAGNYYTVGVKADGTVVAAGRNTEGQCNVQNWHNIIKVACSDDLTIGICADGTAVAAGNDKYGPYNFDLRGVIGGKITDVAVAKNAAFYLMENGQVFCKGSNEYSIFDAENWHDIEEIDCGEHFVIGRQKDGTVLFEGWDMYEEGKASTIKSLR